jgi:WD40 repeat protein
MKSIRLFDSLIVFVFFTFLFSIHGVIAQNTELIPQTGHNGSCTTISLSNDDKIFVSSDNDANAIKFWDLKSGLLIKTRQEHQSAINTLDCSPDGKYMITAAGSSQTGGELILWDFENLSVIKNLWNKKSIGVTAAFFSPDSRRIIFLSEDSILHIVDIQSEIEIQALSCASNMMAVSAGRDAFSIYGYHSVTETYSVDTVKKICTINPPEMADAGVVCISSISELVFSSKNNIVTGQQEDNIYNLTTGKFIAEIKAPDASPFVYKAEFSPDGKYLAIIYMEAVFFSKPRFVRIYRTSNWKEYSSFTMSDNISAVCFTMDSKNLFLSIGDNNYKYKGFEKYNLDKKAITKEFGKDQISGISCMAQNYYGNDIAVSFIPGRINYFDLRTLKMKDTVTLFNKSFELSGIYYDKSGKTLAGYSFKDGVNIWDLEKNVLIRNLSGKDMSFSDIDFSRDGKSVAALVSLGDLNGKDELEFKIMVWAAESGNVLYKTDCEMGFEIHQSPDSRYVATLLDDEKQLCIWEIGNQKPICKSDIMEEKINAFNFSPDNRKLIFSCGKKYGILDIENNKTVIKKEIYTGEAKSIGFMPDNEHAVISGYNGTIYQTQNRNIKYIDITKDEVLFEIPNVTLPYGSPLWSLASDHVLPCYSTESSNIEILNLEKKETSCSLYLVSDSIRNDNPGFIFVCPDNYYYATKNAFDAVAFRLKNKVFSFDQFDLQYNRPDIVLERIGLADTMLVSAYHKAYYKRLKKMKFNETMFSPDFHMPELYILNSDSLPVTTNEKIINLKIKTTDSKYRLDRINVFINDVPIYGMDGINLRSLSTDSVLNEIPVELSQGENKIQVSCLNEKGVESLKEAVWISYEPEKPLKSKLWLFVIGVSEYQDKEHILKYAAKDGRDLARIFTNKKLPFGESGSEVSEVLIDTLFNSSATKENIFALKQKLLKTNVNDEVILYVSGHGLLDDSLDFYFATYDMNFDKPAEHGVLYDDLEGLLDSIPARKKLLLMDACHSGEVDKDENYTKTTDTTKTTAQNEEQAKGSHTKYIGSKSKLGLQNSFELMQELFANLTRGSGAVVISAAQGTESALESSKWNNGAFTYCIINGLKTKAADANNDGSITVSELKEYISTEVEKITDGAQKPTSRRENLEFDWRVW